MSGVEVPRSERDGCQCPPWVIRCVHFEGRILILAGHSNGDDNVGHTCGDTGMHFSPYELHLGLRWMACVRSDGCHAQTIDCRGEVCLSFPDLPAAEAEFERRAEELRQAPVGGGPR